MKVLLTTLNAKYIHKNLAIRWLYVAQKGNHEVSFKEYTIKDNLVRVADEIQTMTPDVIGLSTYIWNGEQIRELVPLLRERLPQTRLVLGGPEVSYKYDEYLTDDVDAILLGEGENSFWDYVNEKENIKGIITHGYCNKEMTLTDLSSLEQYDSPYLLKEDEKDMENRYLYLEASRGCPFRCAYCMASLDNHIREFSLDYLFKQLDEIEKTKVHQVKFLDRTFNASKSRSLAIARRLISFRKDCSFQFEVMADLLDDELIALLAKAEQPSRFRFEVGIQSFNETTLKAVNRHQNLQKLCINVKRLLQIGCVVHCDLIGGLPYEDLDSFKETYQKLFDLKCDEMQVGILKLLRGSALQREMGKYNIIAETKTPYQIISNPWVSAEDVQSIEQVALATERLYNRNLCRKSLIALYDKGIFMYPMMENIGKAMQQLKKPYQPHQVFEIIHHNIDDELIRELLANEYYYAFKQRPVRYRENSLDKKDKNFYFEALLKEGLLTQNDIRYAYFDYGYYNKEKVIQILLYNSDQNYPMRYFVSLKGQYLDKENLNEKSNDCHR